MLISSRSIQAITIFLVICLGYELQMAISYIQHPLDLQIPKIIGICGVRGALNSCNGQRVSNLVLGWTCWSPSSSSWQKLCRACSFYVGLSGWSDRRKSWKSSSFPIYCGRGRLLHAFISLHVTHLSRPALEQPVPADCRLNVKNVSVEELVGVLLYLVVE